MTKLKLLPFVAVMTLISLAGFDLLFGQFQQAATSTTSPEARTVGFRLAEWQTRHVHDVNAADELAEALERVGCEVSKNDHNGHIDIQYRCPNWKTITVENGEYAVQWSSWLAGNGLETVILNPPQTAALEKVRFRMADWRNAHLHDAAQADQFGTMLQMIGCEAERHAHDGHIDIRFRCAEWQTIALHNHNAAHAWQDWLNQNGFETEHSH